MAGAAPIGSQLTKTLDVGPAHYSVSLFGTSAGLDSLARASDDRLDLRAQVFQTVVQPDAIDDRTATHSTSKARSRSTNLVVESRPVWIAPLALVEILQQLLQCLRRASMLRTGQVK